MAQIYWTTVLQGQRGVRDNNFIVGLSIKTRKADNTTELRLAIQCDLPDYDEVQIYFGEGTGYAEWQSLDQIRLLARAVGIARRRFITSFFRHL